MAIYELNDAEAARARQIAEERGLSAMHRWVRGHFSAKLEVEEAEARAQMVMLETSVILSRSQKLTTWLDQSLDGMDVAV